MAGQAGMHSAGDWIAIQNKTFTRWANQYLGKEGMAIEDLKTDFADGVRLARLLTIISGGDSVGKINTKAKMEIQKTENLNKSLQFLKDHDIKLVNVGSGDIYKGNERIILGMLWTIILRFEVTDPDGKAGLLLWVQRSCKGYAHIDPPNVQNFTRDWNTGLPFCALINRYRPDLLEYEGLTKEDAAGNCEKAFAVAEKELGICRLLDVEDIANNPKPDEKSVIAYVAQFFKLFASAQKAEALVRSVENAVKVTMRHDEWMSSYGAKSEELNAFEEAMCAKYAEADASVSTQAVKESIDAFASYIRTEKPLKATEKSEIDGVHTALVSSKRNNKRPAFEPAITTKSLADAWDKMGETEQRFEEALIEKYKTYCKVDQAAQRFDLKAASTEAWIDQQTAIFAQGILGSTVGEVEDNVEAHKIYNIRLGQYKVVFESLHAMADVCAASSNHESSAAVLEKMAALDEKFAAMEAAGEAHGNKLDSALAEEKRLLQLCRDFHAGVEALTFEIANLDDQISEPLIAIDTASLQSMSNEGIASLKSGINAAREQCATYAGLATEIVSKKPDAGSQVAALQARCDSMESQLADREASLAKMLEEELGKEALCKKFAEGAEGVVAKADSIKNNLAGLSGSLEDQKTQLSDIQADYNDSGGQLAELAQVAEEMESLGVVINPYSSSTIHSLQNMWDSLGKQLKEHDESLTAQIAEKKGVEISPEQIAEISGVFELFDTDKDGQMTLAELKDAFRGTGIFLEDDEIERRMREVSPDTMRLSLEQFMNLMLAELKTGDSKEDVIKALTELAGGPNIAPEKIDQHFRDAGVKEFLKTNMGEGNVQAIADDLFSR